MSVIHKFEAAGLGTAPFRVVGFAVKKYQACHGAPIQVGGSCDYCGTGIMDTFYIRGADGREFKVGSDCVYKTGDKGLVDTVKRKANRIKRERTVERESKRIEAAKETFAAHRAAFEASPHPRGFKDRETGRALTLADEVDWMMERAGHSGRMRTARAIEKFVKARE